MVSAVGFVADHLEVLYDLDVEAVACAKKLGIGFTRALGLRQIRETLKQIEAKWAY